MHQILISDKKRIGFLFGAGTSLATGVPHLSVPAVAQMTSTIVERVVTESALFAEAIKQIREEIEATGVSFNIESLLSTIEAKHAVIGVGKLNGLDSSGFLHLAKLLKQQIVELVSVHKTLPAEDRTKLAHAKLATWVSKARRRFPAEIFTTNYDYLFEMALESYGVPYFDGFSGSYEPFFCPEAVEDLGGYPQLLKLWKMHGSLGWKYRESDKAVIRDPAAPAESILIYPSHLKYNTTKKQPYVGLIDRLCSFLQQDDAVLFTCGYSFSDNHINERIATSLRRGANSHVIAFYYDEVWSSGSRMYALNDETNMLRTMATREVGGKMSIYGRRHAIIGGKFGEWQLSDEPDRKESLRVSQYFDEDAAAPSNDPGEHRGNEAWKGTGHLLLPDFTKLACFLNDLSTSDAHQEGRFGSS